MADLLRATANLPSSFHFEGRRIKPGETFVCDSPRMTKMLLDIQVAEIEERDVQIVDLTNLHTAIPDTAVLLGGKALKPRKRGRPRKGDYARRDMRAED